MSHMEEYIKGCSPSTSEGFIPLEDYIKRWECSSNKALLCFAKEIAKQASFLLGKECKVTDAFKEKDFVEWSKLYSQKVLLHCHIPMISLAGDDFSCALDWVVDFVAPPKLSYNATCEPPQVGCIDVAAVLTRELQDYYDHKLEALLLILNRGEYRRGQKDWVRNGRSRRRIIIWVKCGNHYSCFEIFIKVARLKRKSTRISFSFRAWLFSPYSPYLIPQVLEFIYECLHVLPQKSVEEHLRERGVSRYRYRKWIRSISAWADTDWASGDNEEEKPAEEAARKSVKKVHFEEIVKAFLTKITSFMAAVVFHREHLATAPEGVFDSGLAKCANT